MADFDFSEVDALVADLGEAPDTVGPFVNSALQFTANNVKKAAQRSVSNGDKSWRSAVRSISYGVTTFLGFGRSVLKVEVGYEKDERAGALGNLREFGAPDSPAGPLAPHNDLAIALEANEIDFIRGVERAGADAAQAALDKSTRLRRLGTYIRGGELGSS